MTDVDAGVVAALNEWKRVPTSLQREPRKTRLAKRLHVVYREISPYSGVSQYLGFFSSGPKAINASKRYLAHIKRCGDPWKEQAMVTRVYAESDIRLHRLTESKTEFARPTKGQLVYAV